jgi:hypothetical protein
VDPETEEVALEWRSDFEAGPKPPRVVLSGTDYHGLGLRFPATFDKTATHLNSGSHPYPTQGRRDVLEAEWAAVTGVVDSRPATVAVFGRPQDQRGPLKFFSMLDPFAYLSATQGLDKAPIEYARGERFALRYLVAVYPRAVPADTLARRHADWLQPGGRSGK